MTFPWFGSPRAFLFFAAWFPVGLLRIGGYPLTRQTPKASLILLCWSPFIVVTALALFARRPALFYIALVTFSILALSNLGGCRLMLTDPITVP